MNEENKLDILEVEVKALIDDADVFVQTKDGDCTGSCMHDCIVGKNTCDAQLSTWM
ncbi:hypothetical protein RV11_GL000956 [Enterococcus phoeniculicola]|uniref:Uncharacterized protein n=1 Tax=Enterococcus phoeniculicola ATCC BAA-412 TaxID=1158610 RepID=R3W2C4_9ENTE|nr:hypothetical protein [Enterococcus phoeniculicola]EOL41581.1 hypothetical protein UC3_03144 [Enterococcus phoeniculicola ATCC BAA-412]EOT78925.1 hypothetical protein I589_00432 [Enterococcus phoeniculicola ATCC BAA-412]OJG70709.1 hypothetical protein RV11_GL000956 [Enterococcus phoeniculicola]